MATPASKSLGLSLDVFLRQGPVEHADREWLFEQGARNREYFWERRDELLRDHRGRWAMVYGDRQLLIGDDRAEMRRNISVGDLRVAYTELLDDLIECPSILA